MATINSSPWLSLGSDSGRWQHQLSPGTALRVVSAVESSRFLIGNSGKSCPGVVLMGWGQDLDTGPSWRGKGLVLERSQSRV